MGSELLCLQVLAILQGLCKSWTISLDLCRSWTSSLVCARAGLHHWSLQELDFFTGLCRIACISSAGAAVYASSARPAYLGRCYPGGWKTLEVIPAAAVQLYERTGSARLYPGRYSVHSCVRVGFACHYRTKGDTCR